MKFLKKSRRCIVCNAIVERVWIWQKFKKSRITGITGNNPCTHLRSRVEERKL